jgi:hypothetical protein
VILKRRYRYPQHIVSKYEVPVAVYTKDGVGYDYILFRKNSEGHYQPAGMARANETQRVLSTYQSLKERHEEYKVETFVSDAWYSYLVGGNKEAKIIYQ